MKIAVLGCGRWGSFHAWYAQRIGHQVMLWGRKGSKHLAALQATRKNEYLTLPDAVELTDDLAGVVAFADIVIISISAQKLREFCQQLKFLPDLTQKKFVLCMKGLEIGTGKRLTTIMAEELGTDLKTAVWVGPGHVQDFVREIPNCMVIASKEMQLTKDLVTAFASPLIRFYYGEDLLGTEIGAAAKNVMGLAAGMLDGLNYSSLKGALMARGTRELSRLIEKMGGDKMTVYGLSHLGDYEATLFSHFSHNRCFGEDFIRGKSFTKLAEGVYTVEALMDIAREYQLELPICGTVYAIIHEHKDPQEELLKLFLRDNKAEQE
ncbi:putative glycerol-3-phosphate dehydrogenase [Selenomonas ruminantium subsp. lactilytica TAM6421]|uniref:Glycerol-3-phosphate dehydrogenase n=1 Tax=Selenomonas ruminantium subsp. lactilytica (strain NBRC 103574 / TAM6421) TaxID=927704 RepID=I0GTN1_SELRL|nr:NAD(P)H-dependent glycerol-3-phosphate dehydrogenase [Selenomonas ruminantium]BAL84118.1 putative glycerol-3-phosphate dehydrogenase [Selenomonas ruminantium subsp. lactilytica TAM6421]